MKHINNSHKFIFLFIFYKYFFQDSHKYSYWDIFHFRKHINALKYDIIKINYSQQCTLFFKQR